MKYVCLTYRVQFLHKLINSFMKIWKFTLWKLKLTPISLYIQKVELLGKALGPNNNRV